jgi:ubiquinone/menaquinone biosynthesis C-methylase UbiE
MAAGYARSRPPVHRRVLELALDRLGRTSTFRAALDIGCGAGVSTQALVGLAQRCIGLEPNVSMLRLAAGAEFVAGAAEAIPLRHGSVDLITAAGSLNYADVERFFDEAARVLVPDGVIVVYDFSPGRSFRDGGGLEEWFAEFIRRYPWPPHEARELNPAILASIAALTYSEEFAIALPLSRAFYIDYMMTETNVAAAVRRGTPPEEIRRWCADSLAAFWSDTTRDVVFRGYFACLRPIPDRCA